MWKRGEIAPKEEQFLLFSTIFSVYLYFQESNYIFICEMWLFDLCISESPLGFEITRVDCIAIPTDHSLSTQRKAHGRIGMASHAPRTEFG